MASLSLDSHADSHANSHLAVSRDCGGCARHYVEPMNNLRRIATRAGLALLVSSPVVTVALDPAGAASVKRQDIVSKKQAVRAMQDAGYWGIGGATFNDPYYFAAAMSPQGKRVRVTVDARSGKIVRVSALARGAGAVVPDQAPPQVYVPPRIEAQGPQPPATPYYQPPQAPRAIGVPHYPFAADGRTPAWGWCRFRANAPNC
jgi:hypothetical protein